MNQGAGEERGADGLTRIEREALERLDEAGSGGRAAAHWQGLATPERELLARALAKRDAAALAARRHPATTHGHPAAPWALAIVKARALDGPAIEPPPPPPGGTAPAPADPAREWRRLRARLRRRTRQALAYGVYGDYGEEAPGE